LRRLRKDPRHFCDPLRCWFARNRRDLPWRRRHDLYGIWVSEVMLHRRGWRPSCRFTANFCGVSLR